MRNNAFFFSKIFYYWITQICIIFGLLRKYRAATGVKRKVLAAADNGDWKAMANGVATEQTAYGWIQKTNLLRPQTSRMEVVDSRMLYLTTERVLDSLSESFLYLKQR